MADDPRLATSEAVVMRNMEGYVQNSGNYNVGSPRLRSVMYPVTEAAAVGFGNNPSMGWYAHPGGVVMNENPNFNYRVGYGRGIVENSNSPGLVQQIGGGSSENSGFVNRGGGGGGGASCDSRGNVSDQASDEGGDDQSSVKKVKFLCSFGGKIIPRPSDGVLRYVGGQTRIISVKSDISFQELVHKMIDVYGKPVVIRYQLPDGELDALVSVSCPEDLENMMDEYGKLAESSSNGSAKLRVFLFSASELDPSGLLQFGDLLDSGQRYMDAVNGVPDTLGGGIARKVSLGSETSTQNSDGTLGVSEFVDGSSYGQGDGGGLSSPYTVSPRLGAISTHDTPTSMMYATSSPMMYTPLMHAGPSETLSSLQPETDFKRPMPAMMHPQTPLSYDFHKPSGMDFQQATTTYMPAYADPRQQFSSQVSYMNPQGVGIAGPIYRYAAPPTQLRDNTFGIPNQQFMPAVPMSAAPLNNHIGINSNVIQQVVQPPHTRDPYLGENASRARVVQFPVEQNYSAYQSQSPSYQPISPFQAGGGSGLVSSTQHVVPSDGRAIHHPDDNTSVSGTSYDHARQIDGTVERTYMNPHYPHLSTGIQYMPSEQMHGQSALAALRPEYVTYETRPVMQRNVPNDAFLNSPVPLGGDTLSTHSGAVQGNWNQPPPNSLFSNQDPWTLLHDPVSIPSKSNETADEEAFMTRADTFHPQTSEHINKDFIPSNKDEALEDNKQEFTAEEVLNTKDSSSEHNLSNKDENIRQELKSVAEGVAAMVLQSPLPSDSSGGLNDSPSEIGLGRVLDRGVEASTDKIEDVKNKQPEKENSGLPLSEGIGHLQIIKNGDLEELRELGSGTFGTVYHGKWRGTDVAIKRINNRCFAGKPSERSRMIDDFWNEAIKLADLHHPNVVAFYGVVLDGPGDSVATVTEYMVNGSLRQALVRALNRRKRLLIAMDVAFGMEYLHGKNIVHFDLKSDNLLVNLKDPHRPICKVGDLGLSKVKCHTLISGGVRGTLPWMAPELLNGSSSLVSEKVDVFSFGIVMWELLTGEEPYADLHYGVIIGGIVSNTLRPEIPVSCDPEWRALMERCWAPEPLARPSFTEIANELRSMAANLPAKGQSPKE